MSDLEQEIERLKAVIAKIRSHSKPVRMIVDFAERNQTLNVWVEEKPKGKKGKHGASESSV